MTENNPLISIIVPMYNVEQYLFRCVDSLIHQTYKKLEIILVNDGSSDRSGSLAEDFAKKDNRIKVIHQQNKGQGAARNRGIMEAKGEYISFIDSDDWVTPDMIEYLYSLISKNNADYASIEMCITSNEIYEVTQPKENVQLLSRNDMFRLFFRISSPDINYCTCDKLFRADIVKNIPFVVGKRFEDIDYCYKIIKASNLAVVSNRICYFYFVNIQGISNGALKPADYDLLEIWQNVVSDCHKNIPSYEYYAQYNYARAYLGLLGKATKCGVSDNFTDWEIRKKELVAELKKNKKFLLNGNLPLSRKIAIILCCINPFLLEITYKLFRKNKQLETKC